MLLLTIGVLVGLVGFGAGSLSAAFADCNQNADRGIWVKSGQGTMSHGDQVDSLVEENNAGDCTQLNEITAEQTAYMGVGGNSLFDWAEMGWVQIESALGPAFGNVFTEWGLRGKTESCGGNSCIFSSGCGNLGTTITLRSVLNSATNDTWNLDYACNGGGFTVRSTSDPLDANYCVPDGEIFAS